MMIHQEFSLTTFDNVRIFAQCWKPEQPAIAVFCLIHGHGEHSSRYAHVAEYFCRQGIAVTAMDLRGHGKSEGKRGHTPSFEHLMNDVELLIRKTEEMFPAIPLILYGHSVGGNLVLNYAIRRKPVLDGVIATSPYLTLAFKPPAWKVKLAKISASVYPSLSQPTGLDPTAISHNPEEVTKYIEDPLVHDRMSSAFFINIHFAGLYAIDHASELLVPALVMHGKDDKITSHKGTEEFVARSEGKVASRFWEGLYHEMHNEPEQLVILEYIRDWVLSLVRK